MSNNTAEQSKSSPPISNPQRIQSLKNFLAAEEPITIIPSFHYNTPLNFLVTQTSLGPFIAGVNTTVPLWLAIYLRKRNLCRLVAPSFLSVDLLRQVLHHERDPTKDAFSPSLPFRYMEIAKYILSTVGATRSEVHAATGGEMEEIPQSDQVRVLLEDITTVRMDKIRQHFHTLSASNMGQSLKKPMPILDVTGIGACEIAAIRSFLECSFGDHLALVQAGTTAASSGSVSGSSNDANGRTTGRGGSSGGAVTAATAAMNRVAQQQEQQEQQQDFDSQMDNVTSQVTRTRLRRYR